VHDEPALGPRVPNWKPVARPAKAPLEGRHVLLRPVDPANDAGDLYAASHPPEGDCATWTYLPDGPYESADHMREMLDFAHRSEDPLFFTIVANDRPCGMASYLRITPEHGAIEIGHIWFGAGLLRTTAATEAIYLLARHVFDDLGYRRLEWKCNALNTPSRTAADRFGFTFEGVFRKQQVVKDRNRDTAWYAIVDDDWPPIRRAFESWLAPENFGEDGRQRRALAQFRGSPGGVGPNASGRTTEREEVNGTDEG
jgi:RimJ/RimL family protein N-acetyltransferase